MVGARHKLFQGSGEPTGSLTPDPVGKTVIFEPTTHFGYYYSDVSDPSLTPAPKNGRYTYTLFNSNEPECKSTGAGDQHPYCV